MRGECIPVGIDVLPTDLRNQKYELKNLIDLFIYLMSRKLSGNEISAIERNAFLSMDNLDYLIFVKLSMGTDFYTILGSITNNFNKIEFSMEDYLKRLISNIKNSVSTEIRDFPIEYARLGSYSEYLNLLMVY